MKRANFPRQVERRRDEAETRHAAYDTRSYGERMANIERRPGSSLRETARLSAAIANRVAATQPSR